MCLLSEMSVTRSIRVIATPAPIWPSPLGGNRLAGAYSVAVGGNIGPSVTVLPGSALPGVLSAQDSAAANMVIGALISPCTPITSHGLRWRDHR